MDIEVIKKKLAEAEARRLKLVNEINEIAQAQTALGERKQMLFQEALRLDGKAQALKELLPQEEGKEVKPSG